MSECREKFDFGQRIGEGGFATVFRAVERASSEEVAIKVIDKSKVRRLRLQSRVRNEIRLQRRLEHENVVQLRSYFEDSQSVYLVMELCNGGNLYTFLKHQQRAASSRTVAEKTVILLVRQLLKGLQYLHGQGIVHRDLKLSNLLLKVWQDKDGRRRTKLKIADFGFAAQLEHPDQEQFTLCGTPNYIAPEIANQEAHGLPADLWSVGCVAYTLLCGRSPYHVEARRDEDDIRATLRAAQRAKYEPPPNVSDEARHFLRQLLQLDPDKRVTVDTILRHPFLATEQQSGSLPSEPSLRLHSVRGNAESMIEPRPLAILDSELRTPSRQARRSRAFEARRSKEVEIETSQYHSEEPSRIHRACSLMQAPSLLNVDVGNRTNDLREHPSQSVQLSRSVDQAQRTVKGVEKHSFGYRNGSSTQQSFSKDKSTSHKSLVDIEVPRIVDPFNGRGSDTESPVTVSNDSDESPSGMSDSAASTSSRRSYKRPRPRSKRSLGFPAPAIPSRTDAIGKDLGSLGASAPRSSNIHYDTALRASSAIMKLGERNGCTGEPREGKEVSPIRHKDFHPFQPVKLSTGDIRSGKEQVSPERPSVAATQLPDAYKTGSRGSRVSSSTVSVTREHGAEKHQHRGEEYQSAIYSDMGLPRPPFRAPQPSPQDSDVRKACMNRMDKSPSLASMAPLTGESPPKVVRDTKGIDNLGRSSWQNFEVPKLPLPPSHPGVKSDKVLRSSKAVRQQSPWEQEHERFVRQMQLEAEYSLEPQKYLNVPQVHRDGRQLMQERSESTKLGRHTSGVDVRITEAIEQSKHLLRQRERRIQEVFREPHDEQCCVAKTLEPLDLSRVKAFAHFATNQIVMLRGKGLKRVLIHVRRVGEKVQWLLYRNQGDTVRVGTLEERGDVHGVGDSKWWGCVLTDEGGFRADVLKGERGRRQKYWLMDMPLPIQSWYHQVSKIVRKIRRNTAKVVIQLASEDSRWTKCGATKIGPVQQEWKEGTLAVGALMEDGDRPRFQILFIDDAEIRISLRTSEVKLRGEPFEGLNTSVDGSFTSLNWNTMSTEDWQRVHAYVKLALKAMKEVVKLNCKVETMPDKAASVLFPVERIALVPAEFVPTPVLKAAQKSAAAAEDKHLLSSADLEIVVTEDAADGVPESCEEASTSEVSIGADATPGSASEKVSFLGNDKADVASNVDLEESSYSASVKGTETNDLSRYLSCASDDELVDSDLDAGNKLEDDRERDER